MGSLQVKDLMSEPAYSLTPEDDLLCLTELMDRKNIRHVPVITDGRELVGLVSQRDLAHATAGDDFLPLSAHNDLLLSTRIRDIMTRNVATAAPEDALAEAARIMYENKFGCLPVVDGGRLIGILTEADFVRFHTREEMTTKTGATEAGDEALC